MIPPPMPADEPARLAAIEAYRLGGVGREQAFTNVTEFAARLFGVPISLVSIIGAQEQCLRGGIGLDELSTSRDVSFCGHVVALDDVMVIEDASKDERFFDNPGVTGDPFIRFYAGAPLRLKDGQVPGTLCLVDRKPRSFGAEERRQLAALAKMVIDVVELRLSSIIAAERQRELARIKDEFVATTSHELRTPLTAISGSLALLKGGAVGELPPKAMHLLDVAHANSGRLARLVNDILDLEKLTEGRMEFTREPLSAATLLRDVAEANESFAQAHGVRLVADPAPEDLFLMGDADRLMQVLTNLVSNAVKFSAAGGEVRLSALSSRGCVRIEVADSGRGIPADHLDRVFARFSQVDASDSRGSKGSGLGLAIVKEMVEGMGGEVGVQSELGKGSTFHLMLPMRH